MNYVYKITNKITNMFYIGSTIDYNRRIKSHKSNLKIGRSCNPYLQRSYNKYGLDNFDFSIHDLVEDRNMLIPLEKYYINLYDKKLTYNMNYSPEKCVNITQPCYRISLDMLEIIKFNSVKEAALSAGVVKSGISSCLKRNQTTAGGYYWCYDPKSFIPRVNKPCGLLNAKNRLKGVKATKLSRSRKVINTTTKEIYESVKFAANKYKISQSSLHSYLTGKTLKSRKCSHLKLLTHAN